MPSPPSDQKTLSGLEISTVITVILAALTFDDRRVWGLILILGTAGTISLKTVTLNDWSNYPKYSSIASAIRDFLDLRPGDPASKGQLNAQNDPARRGHSRARAYFLTHAS
jgi:hypothetical protein